MGLGGTTKKLQKVANAAEELYAKMNEVIGQLKDLQREVERTSAQVDDIEYEVAEQRAILEALAEKEGVDVEAVLADASLPADPERDGETAGDGDATDGAADEDGTAGGA